MVEDQTYVPPVGAANAAKKALKWRDEHGDEVKAMTRVGWVRANQLAKREKISLDTVKRMAAFARHKKNSKISPENKETPWKDNGYVSWLGWGGDPGIEWAQGIVDGLKESAGAGEEGTDELLKTYLKATPYAEIIQSPHNKLYSFSEFLKMKNDKKE